MNGLYVGITGVLAFAAGFFAAFSLQKSKNSALEIENVRLQEKLNSTKEKIQSAEDYSALIKKEFVNLANQALIEKNKMLNDENQKNLETFLKPLRENLKDFQSKMEEYNITGIKNTQTLKEQIEYLSGQNKLITTQTEKLANAISTNSKFRGSFGEMILERLLKISGLIDKKDDPIKGNYLLQAGFRNLDSAGGSKITPDAGVFTKKFYSNILDRIKELENKYTNLEGLTAPDFTLLFIPFEACMGLIYANNALVEEANRRNIVIVGPSTLLSTLRTVNYTWMSKNQNDNIKEILKTGEGIYAKCQTLIGKLEGLSANFETLRKGFDGVFTSLKGRGGLFGQIAKFRELGFNPANPIDEKYLSDGAETPILDFSTENADGAKNGMEIETELAEK